MEALLCIENSLSVHTLYYIYYNRFPLYFTWIFSFSSSQSNISKIGLCPYYLNPLNTSINPFRVGSGWFPELQLNFCLSHTDVQSCQKLGCIAIILCDVVIMYKLACLQHTSTLLAFRVNKDHDSGEPKLPLADTQSRNIQLISIKGFSNIVINVIVTCLEHIKSSGREMKAMMFKQVYELAYWTVQEFLNVTAC